MCNECTSSLATASSEELSGKQAHFFFFFKSPDGPKQQVKTLPRDQLWVLQQQQVPVCPKIPLSWVTQRLQLGTSLEPGLQNMKTWSVDAPGTFTLPTVQPVKQRESLTLCEEGLHHLVTRDWRNSQEEAKFFCPSTRRVSHAGMGLCNPYRYTWALHFSLK